MRSEKYIGIISLVFAAFFFIMTATTYWAYIFPAAFLLFVGLLFILNFVNVFPKENGNA
jgi:hypothetical protein